MNDKRTKAEKLAGTLDYLVKNKLVPGLLPEDVAEAAELLREQERELRTLRAAQSTKTHLVEARYKKINDYQGKVEGKIIIADPRVFNGEFKMDAQMLYIGGPDYLAHMARSLVKIGTADWISELEQKAYGAIREAMPKELMKEIAHG